MSIKSRKKHDIIKVKGVTRYCHLNAPNKKFEPEYGAYTCDLVVDKDQAEMIKNTLRPLYEEELKTVQEENPNKKKIMQRDFPIEESEDGIVVKSKLKAGGRRKDGSEYKLSIALYDAQGKPLPEDVQVWGGSKVNLAFRPKFYYVPSLGFGVSFELQAVQVLELKNGGVFDAEEDNSEEITANF
jgi:hypothetical protein